MAGEAGVGLVHEPVGEETRGWAGQQDRRGERTERRLGMQPAPAEHGHWEGDGERGDPVDAGQQRVERERPADAARTEEHTS